MLWFKNLMVYRLNTDTTLSAEDLEKKLIPLSFIPCGSLDTTKTGWISPMGEHSGALTHIEAEHILLCANKEEKILPAPVIKQTLQAKIEKIEAEQHRQLKKIEKDSLKDEVLHSLLPRAFSRFSQTAIWIDTKNHLIMVDAASAKRAEDTLALLRKSLGSLPVVPLTFDKPIELTLTEWVRSGRLPDGFTLQHEAELTSPSENGGIIRCKSQELVSDEIAIHIEAGKLVTKLGLEWQERIQLLLCNEGSVKRLKFCELLRDQNEDINAKEDPTARFAADFILMANELSHFLVALIEALETTKKA